jgi:hypothetical protein
MREHGGGHLQLGPATLDFKELEAWLQDVESDDLLREAYGLAARNTGQESAGDRARREQDEAAER